MNFVQPDRTERNKKSDNVQNIQWGNPRNAANTDQIKYFLLYIYLYYYYLLFIYFFVKTPKFCPSPLPGIMIFCFLQYEWYDA